MATDGIVASKQLWHLEAEIPPNGADSPVVLVRWVFDDEAGLKDLLQTEFTGDRVPMAQRHLKPYMLLVVRRPKRGLEDYAYFDRRETKRYLVPLGDMAAYVEFKHPGENEVIGLIVNIPTSKVAEAADKLVHDRDDAFYRGNFRSYHDVPHVEPSSTVTVRVDEALFPPEPPAWAKTFVGCFYRSQPFDQCKFRGRFLLSLLLFTPLALTFGMVARILTLITALVIGFRDIPWEGLNPFNFYDWPWPDSPRRTFWFHLKNGHVRAFAPAILVVHPIVIIVTASLAYAFYGAKHWSLLWTLAYSAGGLLVVAFGVSLLTVVVMIITAIVRGIARSFHKSPDRAEQARLDQEQETALQQATLARLDKLITNDPRGPSLRLRWSGIKRRVCRPYASW